MSHKIPRQMVDLGGEKKAILCLCVCRGAVPIGRTSKNNAR
jgi:hypothetical protein